MTEAGKARVAEQKTSWGEAVTALRALLEAIDFSDLDRAEERIEAYISVRLQWERHRVMKKVRDRWPLLTEAENAVYGEDQ